MSFGCSDSHTSDTSFKCGEYSSEHPITSSSPSTTTSALLNRLFLFEKRRLDSTKKKILVLLPIQKYQNTSIHRHLCFLVVGVVWLLYINIIYIYKKWRVRLHCFKLMANRIPIILPSSPVHSSCVNYFHSVFVYTSVHRVLVFVCVWCVTIVSLPNYCCYCF